MPSVSDNYQWKRNLYVWGGATVFCALFSFIYECNSHGVLSAYMICLCLFPLCGGVLPLLLMRLFRLHTPGSMTRAIYRVGIITLALGSCLCGIIQIYGTYNPKTIPFWISGALLTATGILLYRNDRRRE